MSWRQWRRWTMPAFGIMLACILSACAVPVAPATTDGTTGEETTGSTVESAGGQLTAYTVVAGGKDPEEHELFMDEVERLTGLDINFIKPPGSEYDQRLVTALGAGETVDLMYMTAPVFERLYPQDLFAPLTQCIENSPILSDPEVIDPAEWERIRREDGEIYAVFNKDEGGILPTVRCDWLEELGIEPPTDLDGYAAMLEAFTTQDPDGNGQDDTYGLTLAGLYDIQPFMGTLGLPYGYAQGENACWDIPWATEEAIPIYEWLAQLYEEGILDPNFATNNTGASRELIFSDRAGMMVYWAAWVGLFNETVAAEDPDSSFEMCGIAPPQGANGEALLRAGDDGYWVVHADSEHQEQTCQFLEFWHSPEGNILATLGIEGHDYTVENEVYTLTEVGASHAMDHGAPYPKTVNWENPVRTPTNVPEAQEIVREYAQLQVVREDTGPAMDIVSQYGIQAILGEITPEEAIASMRADLQAQNYIDCE
jgi:putative aldouronate transport system substrate-binding protein